MEHDIITRDAYSVFWAEIWEFSKSQRDIIDAVTISNIIVFEIICNVAYWCQGHPVSLWCWPLTCNLEKCYSLRSFFCMYNLAICSRSQHLLNMNIERNFEATLWRHRWRHHHKKTFCGIIWDDLFISEIRLKLCLIFQNFQNGRHFELATNFFTESYTGSLIYQKDSHEHFRHFELLINALTQILTEIY